ncbi:tetratricopeptide repeat protein [Psychroserpens sp. Hel_I_66]|uniref:tetratricopeptide repeat protein n=1 Tax=Psychroserpens sp. Hel_I_66 TaxID=1250004 RepID=UPI00064789FA|nr:tetratricopeptide repeat protein [Psychroserpens sp. Hel_I_66]
MRANLIGICTLFFFISEAQQPILQKADSLYNNGNYSKAIDVYKIYDNQAEVHDQIAKAYVAIGNYESALDYYKLAAEAQPNNGLILYEYARLLSKTKKFEASIDVFNKLMNIDYRNPNYHYEMGLALERMGDSTAINRFRSAYDLDDTHQKAIYQVAKYYLKKGNHKLVDQYTEKGLESYKDNIELISLKAQSYYHREYYKQSRYWFEKLVELGETSEFIHEKLSIIYDAFSEYELAIEQRKKILELNPYDSNSMLLIGKYYESLKDYVNSEKYIRQALKLKDVPLDYEYQLLGSVLNRQDKSKEAIEAFQKSIKENPENIMSEFFIISTKDKYYADLDIKIKMYEDFRDKYPGTFYSKFAAQRISELKEEKFLKAKD